MKLASRAVSLLGGVFLAFLAAQSAQADIDFYANKDTAICKAATAFFEAAFEGILTKISDKRLKELADMPDEKIDTSDIAELDAGFWNKAKLVRPGGHEVRS
ncbi:MAG: hypothetical protein IT548_07255 [Alphaproteobacteria bacterium]|nr:hypothetical protein [Alphaproteobacteria bacterium]